MRAVAVSVADKRQAFHRLHEAGCFVIPNPWDIGSARMLQGLGFKALATTSSGFAWADCLYAPGLRSRDEIATVVTAVAPKPVNLLVGWAGELSVADISAIGVRRISVGGALGRVAWGGFMRAARQIADEGRFDGFAQAAAGKELNEFFSTDQGERRQ